MKALVLALLALVPAPVVPEPVALEPVAPEPVAPEPVAPEPVAPEPVAPEPVALEPGAPEPGAPDDGAPAASWVVGAERVEVGEPVDVALVAEHPLADAVELEGEPFDDTWVVFTAAERLTLPSGPGFARTRFAFRVASLEPGERELPTPSLRIDGELASVASASVAVDGVLGPLENEPRPPRGFRDVPEYPLTPSARAAWIAGVALAVLLLTAAAVAFVRARRRRRARAAVDEPRTLERLEALAAAREREPVRAAHYELTRLLREAADRGQGVDRRALTDDEWLAVFRSSGSADQAARAERVLARCAEVKYAGRDATKWAVDETIGEARELLLALEASARSAGDGAAPGGRP